jgi:hypothetical protein
MRRVMYIDPMQGLLDDETEHDDLDQEEEE